MAFSQPDPQRGTPEEDFTDTPKASSSPGQADSGILENILRQTLSKMGSSEALDAETTQALSDLVARRKDMPFSLEPIVVELVSIVLRTQLPAGPGSAELCNGAARRVAKTLYDDPPSRRRLEAIWNRLTVG